MCAEVLYLTAPLNITSSGLLERETGIQIAWLQWFGYNLLPCAVMTASVYFIINRLFFEPVFGPLQSLGSVGFTIGLAVFGGVIHIIMPSGTSMTAAFGSMLIGYADAYGVNPLTVAIFLPRVASKLLCLPYQSVPLMVLWGSNYM